MTRSLTRTNFPSSRLIRTLADLAILDVVEPEMAFAEKLGSWVAYTDAITLSTALNASPSSLQNGIRGTPSTADLSLNNEVARVRASLVSLITQSDSLKLGQARIERPEPEFELPLKVATAYAPYRRYYSAHQREMESRIRPLRIQVREALAKSSPALKQLAALDAALDGVLGEREGKLFATVPVLLQRRFTHLFKAHQQKLADTQKDDKPDLWMIRGAWLARFCQELEAVLLAELDVRLEPTSGLIEALNNELENHL